MLQNSSDQIRMFGKSRSHHAILPSRFLGILDMTPSYGWHSCNDTYYFHRDKGSELFDTYLLILTIDGRGAARVDGHDYALQPGSMMLFPREKPHTYFVPEGEHWEFYWIHMTGPSCSSILEYIIANYGLYHEADCMSQIREQIEDLLKTDYSHLEFDLQSHQAIHTILQYILRCLIQPNRETARRKALVSQTDLLHRNALYAGFEDQGHQQSGVFVGGSSDPHVPWGNGDDAPQVSDAVPSASGLYPVGGKQPLRGGDRPHGGL